MIMMGNRRQKERESERKDERGREAWRGKGIKRNRENEHL